MSRKKKSGKKSKLIFALMLATTGVAGHAMLFPVWWQDWPWGGALLALPVLFFHRGKGAAKAPKRDTVIYILRRKGRIVYVGIAYARRVGARVDEHRRGGKEFDRVSWSRPLRRKVALRREARRIRRLQPEYNTQHAA